MKHHILIFLSVVLFLTNQTKAYSENFAILFSGGEAELEHPYNIHPLNGAFWYDIFDAYYDLVVNENYAHENIFLFYGDQGIASSNIARYNPATYGGDWLTMVDFDNNLSTLQTQLANIANIVTEDDNLLIRWISHGGPVESPFNPTPDDYYVGIRDYNNEEKYTIEDVLLFEMINQIKYKKRKIIWETCHSGCVALGNENLNNNKTTIITACNYNKLSYVDLYSDGLFHSDFDWLINSSLMKETPSGTLYDADYNSDGVISMEDLYTHAINNDVNYTIPQLGDIGSLAHKLFVNENLVLENCNLTSNHQYWVETINIRNLTISNNSNITFEIDENFNIERDFNVELGSTFNVINR